QLNQAAEVVHNLRLGPGASIATAVRARSGLSNVDKKFVAQAEVRQASPVRLAQFFERIETRTQTLRAHSRGHPPIAQPGDALQGGIGGAPNQDGQMWTLHRPRIGDDGSKLIVLALKRHLASLTQAFDNLDTLVSDPTARRKGSRPQGSELFRQPTHA